MSAIPGVIYRDNAARSWTTWGPIVIGLLVLYVPTYIGLAAQAWELEENSHGPIVLAIVLWLLWRARKRVLSLPDTNARGAGWSMLCLGLLLYVIGRSQSIALLEVVSQIPVIAGAMLLFKGWAGVRAIWFPLLFILFLVPLPGLVVTALTGPLKQHVSAIVEQVLYTVGYPIARTGVVLSVGPYELLVADACSGLNSMYSLSALGLLYIHLLSYRDPVRVSLLLLTILPIAFIANIVRVLILVLVTYHLGDAAGQGFLHGFAGMVLFVVALGLLFVFDALLGRLGIGGPKRARVESVA